MNLKTNDACRTEFQNLKFRKTPSRYIIYKIDKEAIEVDKVGEKSETWKDFVNAFPDGQYRFGIFDYEHRNHDNMQISRLVFVNWNPDSSPLKGRVLYATAKENFKKYLGIGTRDFTMCSKDDNIEAEIIKELEKI